MQRSLFSRFSLHFTLVLVFALLAALAQWTAFRVSRETLKATVDAQEIEKIQTVGRVLLELLEAHAERARLTARLIALGDSLGKYLASSRGGDAAMKLRQSLDDARVASEHGHIEVTDNREIVLYRSDDGEPVGDRSSAWGVFEALQGESILATELAAGILTVRAIEPITLQGQLLGTICVGFRVDSALLEKLGRELAAELFLVARTGQVLAASTTRSRSLDPVLIQEALTQKIPVFRQSRESHESVGYLPLTIIDTAYVVVAVLDSSTAYRRLDEGQERAAGAGTRRRIYPGHSPGLQSAGDSAAALDIAPSVRATQQGGRIGAGTDRQWHRCGIGERGAGRGQCSRNPDQSPGGPQH